MTDGPTLDSPSNTRVENREVRRAGFSLPSSRHRATVLWIAGLALTYVTGKLAVNLAKWIVLMYLAPGGEAKLILVGYLLSALFPVVLFGLPALLCWWRLARTGQRSDALAVLALELAFLAYFGFQDLQRALADLSP